MKFLNKVNKLIDSEKYCAIMVNNNIRKAKTEKVVYMNHSERKTLFGESFLCRKINENHSRAVMLK